MNQKLTLSFFINFIFLFFITNSQAQVGVGTNIPDSSAQLDVYSNSKGFLPPWVALTGTNIAAPVSKPATGLLVYNTASAGSGLVSVVPGYYYWNGTSWYQVINKGDAQGDMQYWNGAKWVMIPLGTNGSYLKICNGVPTWGQCSPLKIQPNNNPNEAHVDSYNQTGGPGDPELEIGSWTINGTPTNWRSFIKFDQSQIPSTAIIINATLYLYAMPTPSIGNGSGAHLEPANSFFVERITGDWNPNTFTWNNQPATTPINRVVVPQSDSTYANVAINVTSILQDMQTSGNYGFALRFGCI